MTALLPDAWHVIGQRALVGAHLDVPAENQIGKLEVCSGAIWQMHKQQPIHLFAILIEH